jgi:hypothetical protein
MPFLRIAVFSLLCACLTLGAGAQTQSGWTLGHRFDIRANYRNSEEARFRLAFPFPPQFLPVGETAGFMETVDAGSHVELSHASVQLDAKYEQWFAARVKAHAVDKYRRNPTSDDRTSDVEELWVVFGQMPEMLDRPEGTSIFVLAGKAPKVERQPVRLLESYGLAATAFNRFEDVQVILGGTIGRGLYWRAIAANGNPLYFRDANALAGDNGIEELLQTNPDPELKSGFPILYNAETEDFFLDTETMQFGQAIGYRWENAAATMGFDAVAFHYQRDLDDTVDLTGTFYGGDLDLLDGAAGVTGGLPLSGRNKEETGGRFFGVLAGFTLIAQLTQQEAAGLEREAWEVEAGYSFPLSGFVRYVQPAVRVSDINNDFTGLGARHPSPSIWWSWRKVDAGLRIGFPYDLDLTIEYATHDIESPREVELDETLVTLRWRP